MDDQHEEDVHPQAQRRNETEGSHGSLRRPLENLEKAKCRRWKVGEELEKLEKSHKQDQEASRKVRVAADEHVRTLTMDLEKIRNTLNGFQVEKRWAEHQQANKQVEREGLDPLIREKRQEEAAKNREKVAKEAVCKQKTKFRRSTKCIVGWSARLNFAATVTPLTEFKNQILQLDDTLRLFSTTGFGYGYILALGVSYSFFYYHRHGINIFYYTTPSDFLLIIPFVYGIVSLAFLIIVCIITVRVIISSIPVLSEFPANMLLYFVGRPVLRKSFIVMLLFVPLAVTAFGGYCREPTNRVSIVTEPPMQHANQFALIGSTGSYMFLNGTDVDGSVQVIPLSRIVCINEIIEKGKIGKDNGCQARTSDRADRMLSMI